MKPTSTGPSSPSSTNSRGNPSHEEIAARARALWQQEGYPADRDEEIWLEAERQLRRSQVLKQDAAVPGPEERMEELDAIYPDPSGRETTSL